MRRSLRVTGAVVLWVGFTACFFAAPMAWAQGAASPPQGSGEQAAVEEPQKQQFSEEVTVVASPILEGESLTVFGSPRVTVTSRQIEDLGATDLASALRWVPGVTISRYNLVGSYGGGDGGLFSSEAMVLEGQERKSLPPSTVYRFLLGSGPTLFWIFCPPTWRRKSTFTRTHSLRF